MNSRQHWESIYATKSAEELSWTQNSLQLYEQYLKWPVLRKDARVIDVGGGDSLLVDVLLDNGFENVSVLDISARSLERARNRLGKRAELVTWIVGDVVDFTPKVGYDFWHDRATFHFLTTQADINTYLSIVRQSLVPGGRVSISVFSDEGPLKCSGLPVVRYSESNLDSYMYEGYERELCYRYNHITPFNTTQQFLHCIYKRLSE